MLNYCSFAFLPLTWPVDAFFVSKHSNSQCQFIAPFMCSSMWRTKCFSLFILCSSTIRSQSNQHPKFMWMNVKESHFLNWYNLWPKTKNEHWNGIQLNRKEAELIRSPNRMLKTFLFYPQPTNKTNKLKHIKITDAS